MACGREERHDYGPDECDDDAENEAYDEDDRISAETDQIMDLFEAKRWSEAVGFIDQVAASDKERLGYLPVPAFFLTYRAYANAARGKWDDSWDDLDVIESRTYEFARNDDRWARASGISRETLDGVCGDDLEAKIIARGDIERVAYDSLSDMMDALVDDGCDKRVVLSLRAMAQLNMQHDEGAEGTIAEIIAADPNFGQGYVLAAYVACLNDDNKSAHYFAKKAIEVEPAPHTYSMLESVLELVGEEEV